MTRPRLEFLNTVFHPGINTTIRLGDKWAVIPSGTMIDIVKTGDEQIRAKASIVYTQYWSFLNIPLEALLLEHDAQCHSVEGLITAMRQAYGDKFTINSYVTVLGFEIVDKV